MHWGDDHELAFFVCQLMQSGRHQQLPLREKRSLRLIQYIPLIAKTLRQPRDKRLAM
ncbi:hypothetical protein [Herbaspirillum lusitanum]|uniref:hypothetical protein n=1 Tax=Herbaspirillum lusitanum TaxID=213312 RepID=UPI0022382C9A|nr:hypothetical protein [Herbaspirillum lusitanum]